MGNGNVDENGCIYGKYQIAQNTWCISYRWQNFIYLLEGDEKALLIDTGSGEGNIREIVESITDKPLIVANTHGHFDHSGGNSCWPLVYMSKKAAEHAKEPFSPVHREWFENQPWPDYEIHFLEEGDRIDLGNRTIEIIGLGGHSEGSLAFLDLKMRFLFTGDEIESGQVLMFVRNEPVPLKEIARQHLENMKKLMRRRAEYDLLWPAHNGAPLVPDLYINDFMELDQEIIEGTAKECDSTAGFGFPEDTQAIPNPFASYGRLRRLTKGTASVIYAEQATVYHNK